jgi:hypothetical protein
MAIWRMDKAGVTVTSTNQVMAERAADWPDNRGRIIQQIMYEEILHRFVED